MKLSLLALVGLALCLSHGDAASAEGTALLRWVSYLMYNSPRRASGFICELEIGPHKGIANIYKYKVKLSQYKCDVNGLKREVLPPSDEAIDEEIESQEKDLVDINKEIEVDDKETEAGVDQLVQADLLFLDVVRSSLTDEELRLELLAALNEMAEALGEPVWNLTETKRAIPFTQTCTWDLKNARYLESIGRTKAAALILRIRNVLSHSGNVKLMRDAMHNSVLHKAVDRMAFCSGLTIYVKYPERYPAIFL